MPAEATIPGTPVPAGEEGAPPPPPPPPPPPTQRRSRLPVSTPQATSPEEPNLQKGKTTQRPPDGKHVADVRQSPLFQRLRNRAEQTDGTKESENGMTPDQ